MDKNPTNDPFLRKLFEEVKANLRNEQFGVAELADRMSMSRSHLHRKLKQATGQSANQFISFRVGVNIDLRQSPLHSLDFNTLH